MREPDNRLSAAAIRRSERDSNQELAFGQIGGYSTDFKANCVLGASRFDLTRIPPEMPPFPVAGQGPRGTSLDEKIARFAGLPRDF
jgi:hypothetical protein